MKRNKLASITTIVAMSLMLSFLGGCTCAMKSQLAGVSTSEQEVKAFKAISNCSQLYTITFFDHQGNRLGADNRGDKFSNVGSILIRWGDGVSVNHHVINPENISLLLVQ